MNCDGFLLYLCRCRCETSTCRRSDPGGYWEMGEQQVLCAGWRSSKSGVSRSGRGVFVVSPVYTNGIEEELFKGGFCLPAGPYVTDEDVRYIVEWIKEGIVG